MIAITFEIGQPENEDHAKWWPLGKRWDDVQEHSPKDDPSPFAVILAYSLFISQLLLKKKKKGNAWVVLMIWYIPPVQLQNKSITPAERGRSICEEIVCKHVFKDSMVIRVPYNYYTPSFNSGIS